ncbi:MAG: nucleotidyltransferase domain-containing protein [Gammaproteobacteria bacterium]|nr:nucleotidyltransferase domain-containing protein [Gammaproteobacteria bacterium]
MRLKNNEIQKIISFLQSKMKLRLLILYGSYASGDATPQSDIDLAFMADEEIEPFSLWWDISQELAAIMNVKSIDLVDIKKIDDVFRFIIVSTGEVIFQEGNFDHYLDLAYTKYLQLNDDRHEILKHYSDFF